MSEALSSMRIDFDLQVAKVATQADQINRAMDGIGGTSTETAGKFDRATARMVARVQEQTIAMQSGGRANSAYFESLAKSKGVEKSLEPFIQKLKEVEAAQSKVGAAMAANDGVWNKTGTSVKQLSFAMRQVPMQFTDIFVSLAAGQNPMQVFLQQGGQLKDLFGGIGPAARALGGYLLRLLTPFNLLLGSLAAAGVAWFQGSRELELFNRAAVMSGNTMALSASQYTQARDALVGLGATKGKASEVLTEIAANSQIAASRMAMVGETAILLEKTVGVKVGETVKAFASLAEDPVKGVEKLNQQYRFLTAAVYEQIRALDDQGRKVEAARVAEDAYSDAMKRRASTVTENIGYIERAWKGVISAAKGAWDAMLSVGRGASLGEQLAQASRDLALAQKAPNPFIRDRDTESARQRIANLQEMVRMEQRAAELAEKRQRIEQAGIAAIEAVAKANERGLTKQQQMNKALEEYRRNIESVRAANPNSALLDPQKIAAAEAAIRAQFTDKGGSKKPSFDSSVVKAYADALADLGKIAAAAEAKTEDLSKTQAKLREIMAAPEWGNFNRQQQEQVIATAALAQAEENRAEVAARAAKAEEDAAKVRVKSIAASQDATDKLRKEIDAEIERAARVGLSKQAIGELDAAQQDRIATELELQAIRVYDKNLDDAERTRLMDLAKLHRDLAAAKRGTASAEAAKEAGDEYIKQATRAQHEWERTNERIADSFVDALMRGGKNVAEYLKDLFRTLVLRPLLQPIGNLAAGAVNTGLSMAGNAMGMGSMLGAGGAAMGTQAALGFANMTGAGLDGFLAASGGFGTMSAGASISGMLAAIPVWGWAALAAAAVAGLASSGETRVGGQYVNGAFIGGPSGGQIDGVAPLLAATMQSINETLRALGSTAQLGSLVSGLEQSEKGKGFAFAGGSLSTGATFGQGVDGQGFMNRRGSMSDQEALAAFSEELKQATLQALQAADVPGILGDYLRSLGNIDALSGGALDEALARINKALTEKQSLEARLFELTSTEAEKLAKVRADELAAVDSSNIELFKRIYALEDEKKAAEDARIAQEKAAAIAQERMGLERQLLQMHGDTAALRRLELAELDPSNVALQERIWALQDEAAAIEKANALMGKLRSALPFFLTADEMKAQTASDIAGQFNAATGAAVTPEFVLGMSAQDYRGAYMQFVAEGNTLAAETMIELASSFQTLVQSAQDTINAAEQKKQRIADERFGLETRLLQLQGDTAALRERELAALDPSNRALLEQIFALEDAKAAEDARTAALERQRAAAERLRETWARLSDSMLQEAMRLRGAIAGATPSGGLAFHQSQFAIALASAQSGNQRAAGALPGLSQAVEQAALMSVGSLAELNTIRAQLAVSLEGTAQIRSGNEAVVAELQALKAETVGLRAEVKELRGYQRDAADTLQKWDTQDGGLTVTVSA